MMNHIPYTIYTQAYRRSRYLAYLRQSYSLYAKLTTEKRFCVARDNLRYAKKRSRSYFSSRVVQGLKRLRRKKGERSHRCHPMCWRKNSPNTHDRVPIFMHPPDAWQLPPARDVRTPLCSPGRLYKLLLVPDPSRWVR